jgi:hypothetical protein
MEGVRDSPWVKVNNQNVHRKWVTKNEKNFGTIEADYHWEFKKIKINWYFQSTGDLAEVSINKE